VAIKSRRENAMLFLRKLWGESAGQHTSPAAISSSAQRKRPARGGPDEETQLQATAIFDGVF
jgi:hypothetical protein